MSFLDQFRRVTSGGRFIPVVDGLRCIAILSVILYHIEDYVAHKGVPWNPDSQLDSAVHHVLHSGHVGVPLFFALSGFILAWPFYETLLGAKAGRSIDLRRYYLRRLTRLEPPYLVNLAIATVLLLLVKGVAASDLLPHLAASACYVHNQVYGELSTINGVAWSLEIEVQFYLLAPFLVQCLIACGPVARRALPIIVIAALVVARSIWGPWPPRVALSLAGTAEHFLAGMLLADLYVTRWRSAPDRCFGWDAASLVAWPLIFTIPNVPGLASGLPVLTCLAYAAAFRGRITHRLLTWTPAVIVGGMCYTLYLYHFFVISLFGRYSLPADTSADYVPTLLTQCMVIAPVVIVSGAILYRLFERPFMAWQPAAGQRRRGAEVDAVAADFAEHGRAVSELGTKVV